MELKKCEVCEKEFKNLSVHMRKHNKEPEEKIVGKRNDNTVNASRISTEDPMVVKMDQMISGLNTVAGALDKLIRIQSAPIEKKDSFIPEIEDETYPKNYMPKKYREIIDSILSKEFDARVIDFEDRTEFQLDIFVPDKFSSLSKKDRENGIKDVRTRIIPRAIGENGVRDWCKLVRNNLTKYYHKNGIAVPFGQ